MSDNERAKAPEAKFQFGGVSASVFVNEAQRNDGSTFVARKTLLQRTYMDARGDYQSTTSLDVHDLPKAMLALQRAYEHCLTAPRQANGNEEVKSDG